MLPKVPRHLGVVFGGALALYIGYRRSGSQRRVAMDTANRVVWSTGVSDVFKTTTVTLLLLLLLLSLVAYVRRRQPTTVAGQAVPSQPPPLVLDGPTVFPVIGSLHAMDGAQDRPFRRFTQLAHRYGPVYALRMGSMPCVIVNDYPSIKDVLITNGSKFGGRPNFIRYNVLFGGDRNNCKYI